MFVLILNLIIWIAFVIMIIWGFKTSYISEDIKFSHVIIVAACAVMGLWLLLRGVIVSVGDLFRLFA